MLAGFGASGASGFGACRLSGFRMLAGTGRLCKISGTVLKRTLTYAITHPWLKLSA